ncbi:glycosyltransferase family 4 protein [Hypoxylon argillaceum]|nr:glycosyltransferase family 4 protein [Hypoxylon argillaceum]
MSSADHKAAFFASCSSSTKHHWSPLVEKDSQFAPSLTPLFIGIAYAASEEEIIVSMAFHDHTYLVDYTIEHLPLKRGGPQKKNLIAEFVIDAARQYEHENNVKFIGAAMPKRLVEMSPRLCSRLWLDLDVVPLVISYRPEKDRFWIARNVDEQADSMARKCALSFFGPSLAPILQVGFRGVVMGDSAFRANMATLEDHRALCGEATWAAMMQYATIVKENKTRIAFFSSTPQGGGVALMRHALRRFSRLIGVDLNWYVPKPRPGVFRSTKDMHNILQGVNKPDKRLTQDEQDEITDWITHNAKAYWLSSGGPLRPVEEGGAHIIVVDDPQMPTLIPLIKKLTPNRPVIYRSHIQIRSDLIEEKGSPQNEAWGFLWEAIRHSDLFISHPIPEFVPKEIPRDMVAYMPATTDWLDGLNKPISKWASSYYLNLYNRECASHQMTQLLYPKRNYIVQIARFDPAKGIPTVLNAYASFRTRASKAGISAEDIPQLVIAGNSSIDDPDAGLVFDEALTQIEARYPSLLPDISIMRLQANDQLLNTLVAHARVVLQLSTREGFEVKVSEALHAGRPVIATRAGGLPIQVRDGANAFLVAPGDHEAVAGHLVEIFRDRGLWERMSGAAAAGVSDEVGTVGNALCWYYLAAKLAVASGTGDARFPGNGRWINDLARMEAGYPYEEGENRLPRRFTEEKEKLNKPGVAS